MKPILKIQYYITLCLFLVLLLAERECYAESYNFTTYTIEDGLPQSQVLTICQDRDGYLWFGTYGGGACKYDGVKFTTYTAKDSLLNDVITTIFEDSKGNIWFGTHRGLSKYDGKRFTHYTEKEGFNAKNILCIFEDNQANIWIGTARSGAKKFDGKTFTTYARKDGLSSNFIFTGVTDKQGRVWLGTYGGGVCMFDGMGFTNYTVRHGLADNRVYSMCVDKESNVWFGTSAGISKFDGNNFTSYSTKDGIPHPIVRAMCVDRKGNVWFGSNGGVSKYDGKNFITFTENEGLCQNKVRSIIEDREGNLWIGTNGGVSKFSDMTFTMITTEDGLCDNEVLSIIEDSKGNYWFGTAFGVSKFSSDNMFNLNKNNFTNYYVEDGLSTNIIWTLLEDKNEDIWFGTNRGGINILKNTQSKKAEFSNYTKEKNGLPNNIIYSLLEDKHNNIWVATNRGISVYDGTKFKNLSTKDGLIGNITSCLHETKDGKILIGTGSGMSIYDASTQSDLNNIEFINIDNNHGLEYPNIYTIKEDWDGNIWIGTFGGGVFMLKYEDLNGICDGSIKPDSTNKIDFVNFNEKDGLSANSVVLMEFDNHGFLWLGTIKGINKLDIYNYLKTGEKKFRFYGKDKGFRGIECNINSICKDSKGNLWFGTIKGVYLYNPDEDKENTVAPLTHINGIRLFYEKENLVPYGDPSSENLNLPNELKLPHSQNHVTFDFIGISLTIPEKVTYRYQLIGFDKGWSPITTENYVTYSNLSAGEYTFKVKACNNDGFWNEEASIYSFSITPPFWKTWWFLNSMILIILGSIYSIHKLRIRSIEIDRKRLEKTVENRTYELTIEKEKTEQVNTELVEQKRQLEETNNIIEEKNRHITDSILYARHIQEAIFPRAEYVNEYLPNSFGLYKPKEIVSGDFAWFNFKEDKVFIAAVDCTGHGVPGAFLSVLGNTLLHQIINEISVLKPGEILKLLHKHVQTSLHQLESDTDVFDGMDIALCSLEKCENKNGTVAKIEYAGAFRPLYHVRRNKENTDWEVNVIKANQLPIGGNNEIPNYEFTNHEVEIKKDEAIYIFSDGITDQFGGENAKKFTGKRLEEVLIKAQELEINDQQKFVEDAIDKWKGDLDQTDDILMIGVKF
ncbi:MAG: hypothetical protein COC01_00170 [Bacteroidetes bacterium]|nr:MAG: hypothetical protein COC01_00170 [Bacteroidota bacterium]